MFFGKKLSKCLLYIAMPLFVIAILIFSVDISAGDEVWLKKEYGKLNISGYTGMDTETMTAAFSRLVNFMKGETDSLDMTVRVNGVEREMFGEREKAHMKDVRRLYSGVMTAGIIFLVFAVLAAALFLILFGSGGIRMIAKSFLYALGGVLLLILIIALFAAVDFYGFWKLFHIIFLDFESSVFDPAVSLMIRICPLELFRDLALRIVLTGFGINGIFAAASAIYLVILKKQERTLNPRKIKRR